MRKAVITEHAVQRLMERLPHLLDPAGWLEAALSNAEEAGSYRRQDGSGNWLVRAVAGDGVRAELVVGLTEGYVTLVTVLVYERRDPRERSSVSRQRHRKGTYADGGLKGRRKGDLNRFLDT